MGKLVVVMSIAATLLLLLLLTILCWEVTQLERTFSSFYFDNEEDAGRGLLLKDFLYLSKYDVMSELQAPRLYKWWQLRIVSRLLVSSPLGDVMLRRILIQNGILDLVEFANLLQDTNEIGKEYGMGEPIIRLSQEEYNWHLQSSQSTSSMEILPEPTCDNPIVDDNDENKEYDANNNQYRSVRDFHRAYKSGEITPRTVLKRLLAFIKETDKELACVEEMDSEERLLKAAMESEERYKAGKSLGIWDGVPVFVKSYVAVKGLRVSNGKQISATNVATEDDITVTRFRTAGALVIGTTIMHEKGVQNTGFNPWYQGPYNPYDLTRFTGGSSSGSAVVVATGMSPVAMGWDGGGSIRVPASWSGTVGFATGYSRTPITTVDGVNVAQVLSGGPLSATVQDAADAYLLLSKPLSPDDDVHLYHTLYGHNGPPPPHLQPRWKQNERKITIGVYPEWVSHRSLGPYASNGNDDNDVYQTFQECVHRLISHKQYTNKNFTIPHLQKQAFAHAMTITSSFSFTSLNEFYKSTNSRLKGQQHQLQPATEIQVKLGYQIKAIELMACQRIRAFAIALWRDLFLKQNIDVILTPTTPMTALRRPDGSDILGFTDSDMFVKIMRYLWPTNLLGLPSIAVPVGVDNAGLPISIQVICLHWHEADCLSVAADIEQLFANDRSKPPSQFYIDLLAPE